MDREPPRGPPSGFTVEESILETPKSRLERETYEMLQAEAEEKRMRSHERSYQPIRAATSANETSSKSQLERETFDKLEGRAEQNRSRSFYDPRIQRRPVGMTTISENSRSRMQRDTLTMLGGNPESGQADPDQRPPLSASSSSNGSVDWDAPPPYDQSFGDSNRRISTSVLGMVTYQLLAQALSPT